MKKIIITLISIITVIPTFADVKFEEDRYNSVSIEKSASGDFYVRVRTTKIRLLKIYDSEYNLIKSIYPTETDVYNDKLQYENTKISLKRGEYHISFGEMNEKIVITSDSDVLPKK